MQETSDEDLLISIFRQINGFLEERCLAVGTPYSQPDLQAQRSSQVGRQISTLLAFRRTERPIPYPKVEQSIKILQHLLCTSPLGTFCRPADFYKTPLGGLINDIRLGVTVIGDALTPTQAAREIGVSRQTIYDWINQGRLDPVWVNDRPFMTHIELAIAKNQAFKAKKIEGNDDGK